MDWWALSKRDEGFATPVFMTLALVIALAASAYMVSSQAELRSVRNLISRKQRSYELEGLANRAVWTLFTTSGQASQRGELPSTRGLVRFNMEPEALKLSPLEAARPTNVALLQGLLGSAEGVAVSQRLSQLKASPDVGISRQAVLAVSADKVWQRCGTTLVSPFSRLTGVAVDNEPNAGEAKELGRAGEVWRVSVIGQEGRWIDRIVRFTGQAADPVAVLDQLSGVDRGRLHVDCLAELAKARNAR